jgi:hypothetical protein
MARFYVCLIVLLIGMATAAAQTLTSIPSSSADDPKAFWGAVMQEFYGPYDKSLKCWVGSADSGKVCMRPHLLSSVLQNGTVTHYVAMAGYAVPKEGGRQDCHACPGKLGLVVLRPQNTRLALVARNSLAEDTGSWGAVPPEEFFRVVRLGQENYGWLMEFYYTGQGYTEGGVTVFGPVGDKIVDLGFISTHSDNAGTCGDGLGACYVHSYEILTDPQTTDALFGDLLARKADSADAGDQPMFRVPFSQDTLKYVTPEALEAALGK